MYARDRLAQISHHFLSGHDSRAAGDPDGALRITVLEDPSDPATLLLEGLARAFAEAGRCAAVIDASAQYVAVFRPVAAAGPPAPPPAPGSRPSGSDRLMALAQGPGRVDVLLSATPEPPPDRGGRPAIALIPVPATPEGMRHAYLRLKRLLADTRPSLVGATITDAQGPRHAEACFRKFALAAARFLGISIKSYACLPPGRPHHPRPAPLREIAALLLGDQRLLTSRKGDGTNRNTGAGHPDQREGRQP